MSGAMTAQTIKFDAYHVLPDSPQMQRDFLYVVASLAKHSGAPYAADIVRISELNAVLPVAVEGFQEYHDRGLGGLVTLPTEHRPRAVVMGGRPFIQECGLEMPAILESTAQKWESEPDSVILLAGWDAWVRGVLKFRKV